jgi:hypothetical protein
MAAVVSRRKQVLSAAASSGVSGGCRPRFYPAGPRHLRHDRERTKAWRYLPALYIGIKDAVHALRYAFSQSAY